MDVAIALENTLAGGLERLNELEPNRMTSELQNLLSVHLKTMPFGDVIAVKRRIDSLRQTSLMNLSNESLQTLKKIKGELIERARELYRLELTATTNSEFMHKPRGMANIFKSVFKMEIIPLP